MDREDRRQMLSGLDPDPHDVPGYGRPGGIDDPVPNAEYDDHPEPAEGSPSEVGEETHAPIIRDRAEQLHDEVHESDRFDDTKFDCWGARTILRLADLEADRPAKDAPDHEHEAYAHERAATLASIASDLLSAVAYSDVVNDVETGQLLVGRTATHELVSDHHQAARWVREEARQER